MWHSVREETASGVSSESEAAALEKGALATVFLLHTEMLGYADQTIP